MAETALKEYTFTWEGTDRRGARVKGQSVGPSESLVKSQLRRQGIVPIRVRRKSDLFAKRKKKITAQDIAIFSRQLSTMMTAGLPLVQALELVGRTHENPSVGELILDVKSHIEGGGSLSESLARHPKYFDDLYVNLVEAGERSGALETLLDKIATYKEKTEALKKKVRKALTYPTAVMFVAVIVSAILLIFVVPQFEQLFVGFGADLPAFTKAVIGLSRFVQASWWKILLFLVAVAVGFKQAHLRSPTFRRLLDRITLRLPIIGQIVYKSAVARYARTLATMFTAGVPLVEALDSVAKAAGNIIFTEAIQTMREQVSTGQSLALTMQQTTLFPPMATQMVQIGEESGALDDMCSKVADYFESEVDIMVDQLSSLLEPMIMALLGVIVGSLVIAMYLPIFKLGQAI